MIPWTYSASGNMTISIKISAKQKSNYKTDIEKRTTHSNTRQNRVATFDRAIKWKVSDHTTRWFHIKLRRTGKYLVHCLYLNICQLLLDSDRLKDLSYLNLLLKNSRFDIIFVKGILSCPDRFISTKVTYKL